MLIWIAISYSGPESKDLNISKRMCWTSFYSKKISSNFCWLVRILELSNARPSFWKESSSKNTLIALLYTTNFEDLKLMLLLLYQLVISWSQALIWFKVDCVCAPIIEVASSPADTQTTVLPLKNNEQQWKKPYF